MSSLCKNVQMKPGNKDSAAGWDRAKLSQEELMQLGTPGCLMTGLEQQELRMKACPAQLCPSCHSSSNPGKATDLLPASILTL